MHGNKFSLIALPIIFFAACNEGPGNKAAYQDGTNLCSKEFVADAQTVTFYMKNSRTASDREVTESVLNEFEAKYKNVNCKQEGMFNVNEEVAKAKAEIKGAPNSNSSSTVVTSVFLTPSQTLGLKECDRKILDEFNELVRTVMSQSIDDFDLMYKKIDEFKNANANVICEAMVINPISLQSEKEKFDTNEKMEEIKNVLRGVETQYILKHSV